MITFCKTPTNNDNRYLKGIKVNFISDKSKIDDGASFDFSDFVYGNEALLQDSVINIYTKKGSDTLNQNRGTTLISDTWKYGSFEEDQLTHVANFAAEETKDYINDDILNFANDSPYNTGSSAVDMDEPLLNKVTIVPGITKYGNIIYNTSIETIKGQSIGDQTVISKFYD